MQVLVAVNMAMSHVWNRENGRGEGQDGELVNWRHGGWLEVVPGRCFELDGVSSKRMYTEERLLERWVRDANQGNC